MTCCQNANMENMEYYQNLPDPPGQVNCPAILKRLIDGLGFRYRYATEELNMEDIQFRPVESSWNIEEVNNHIFHLTRMTADALVTDYNIEQEDRSFLGCRLQILTILDLISKSLGQMDDETLTKKTVYLRRTSTHYSFWYLINGFIADALTHVGQIISWRRMAGNPVARISPFTGLPF